MSSRRLLKRSVRSETARDTKPKKRAFICHYSDQTYVYSTYVQVMDVISAPEVVAALRQDKAQNLAYLEKEHDVSLTILGCAEELDSLKSLPLTHS